MAILYCLAPRESSKGSGMLCIDSRVYWDLEAKKKTGIMQASWSQGTLHSSMLLPLTDKNKRNQLDLLRLLSKGLPPLERVERIKVFGKNKGAEDKSKLK